MRSMSSPTLAATPDTALEGLRRQLVAAKGGDPLAPVTVVAPSGYSAVYVRRTLGTWGGAAGGRGWANVTCTTLPALLSVLSGPGLATRGLRAAPAAADLEVVRAQAGGSSGWLGEFAAHPAAVVELRHALAELRRCPAATLDTLRRRGGRGGALVELREAVRRRLHDAGLADPGDVTDEALDRVRRGPAPRGLGTVVAFEPGPLGPAERGILRGLGAAVADPSDSPPAPTFTHVRRCADPDEEVRDALRSILAAADAGVALWDQAVFHPPGPTYARILRQGLAEAGVAANGPERGRLHRFLAGRALLALLELAAGGEWRRHEVIAWLSSAPIATAPGGPVVPAGTWDAVSAGAGVVRGVEEWAGRLDRVAGRGGEEAAPAAALAAFMEELVARAAPPGDSWRELAAWAAGLLDRYLCPATGRAPWPQEEEAAARQVRQVVCALGDLDAVAPGPGPLSFRRALRAELERTALDAMELPDGGFGDGVFVGPYSSARGLRFHRVVVSGLADALVPGRGGGDGLLDEDLRRTDTSGALRTAADRREAGRRDLWAAVAAGTTERVGTLPRGDPRSGRAQTPSRWLRLLVDTGTAEGGVDSYAAGLVGTEPVLSTREFELRELARWVDGGGDPTFSPAVATDGRLSRGFDAARGRAASRATRFDGYIGPGLVPAFDPETPVSATRFETYAACPRRFLFDRVLGVTERVRPEDLLRIEPVTKGTLVHAILEAYVAERVAGAPRSLDRLLAIAEGRLDDAERSGLVGKRLLWRMDRSAIVRELVRFDAEEGDVTPVAAELPFGGEEGGPAVGVLLDDGRTVAFRGSVDRVDRTAGGHLLVSDYKTGRQGRLVDLVKDPVAGGRLLQLPLYALAAAARFEARPPVHARYWLLSGERSAPCYHLVVTPEVEARFRQVVGLIADAVESGCFPGVPGAPTFGSFVNCRSCDFDAVCPTARDREWGRVYSAPELRGVVRLVEGGTPDGLDGVVVKRFVDPDAPDVP